MGLREHIAEQRRAHRAKPGGATADSSTTSLQKTLEAAMRTGTLLLSNRGADTNMNARVYS